MTENEALYCLKAGSERHSELCEECYLYGKTGCDHCYDDATDIAIQALSEIQQYRAIGTVEDIQLIFSLCKDLTCGKDFTCEVEVKITYKTRK